MFNRTLLIKYIKTKQYRYLILFFGFPAAFFFIITLYNSLTQTFLYFTG